MFFKDVAFGVVRNFVGVQRPKSDQMVVKSCW